MKRYKIAKRVIASLLCFCLVFGSVSQARIKSYAFVSEAIAGGAVIGGSIAFAYLIGMLGVTAPTPEPYSGQEALSTWANEQIASYKTWAKELHAANADAWHPEELDAQFDAWLSKLGQGVLDKSSEIWTDLKGWLSSKVYKNSSSVDDKNVFSGVNTHYYSPVFEDDRGTCVLEISFTEPLQEQAIFSYMYNGALEFYLIFKSECKTNSVKMREYFEESGNSHWHYSKNVDKTNYEAGTIYWTNLTSVRVSNYDNVVKPNFMGTYNDCTSSEAFQLALEKAKSLSLSGYAAGTADYGFAGGISDVYLKSNVLDNVDIVGGVDAPTREGALSIPIAWPLNADTLVGTLGKLKDGSVTWEDVLTRVGATAIAVDVAADVPYIIGNEGVTTKEYTYAKDETKDEEIDIPEEGTLPSPSLGSYTLSGLEKLFPFCLPFDLIDFIRILAAPAEAPKFTWPFKYPTLGGMATYDIEIDLSKFDSVAEIFRDMECLAFIVGLIVLTRSRMIRG